MTCRRIVVLALTVVVGLALALVCDPGKVSSMDAQQLPNAYFNALKGRSIHF